MMKSEDIKTIKELLRVIRQSGLGSVEIETEGITVRTTAREVPSVTSPVPSPPSLSVAEPQGTPSKPSAAAPTETNRATIVSPMIGTFYRASSPEAAPYVEVGDTIKVGQTVCMVEAMKLFNEIEADIAGTVVEVLVDNASPVQYNQPLFVVDTHP